MILTNGREPQFGKLVGKLVDIGSYPIGNDKSEIGSGNF